MKILAKHEAAAKIGKVVWICHLCYIKICVEHSKSLNPPIFKILTWEKKTRGKIKNQKQPKAYRKYTIGV